MAVTLDVLDRSTDAVAVLEAVLGRFGDATEPAVRRVVALTRAALSDSL